MATKSTMSLLIISLSIFLFLNDEANVVTASRVNLFTRTQSSPTQLAQTAISDCLAGAKHASATVSNLAATGGLKPREAAAVKDCLVTVGDAVLELKRSLEAMRRGGGSGDQASNVCTWVSAALTDENTCMDGFADGSVDGEVRRKVRGEIVKVANLIGNALSVIKGLVEPNVSP